MKDINIQIKKNDFEKLQKLIADFESYYENDDSWDFDDLEAQRKIAYEMVGILNSLKL